MSEKYIDNMDEKKWYVTFCLGGYIATCEPCEDCKIITNKVMFFKEAKIFSDTINKLKGYI